MNVLPARSEQCVHVTLMARVCSRCSEKKKKMIHIIPVPRGILSSIHKIALVSIICVLRVCKYRYLYVSISINTENGIYIYIYIDVYRCEISTTVVCVFILSCISLKIKHKNTPTHWSDHKYIWGRGRQRGGS